MRVLTLWAAIGIVAILGFMAKPSAAGPALAGVSFGSQDIGTIPVGAPGAGLQYNYLVINPNGTNYVIGSGPGLISGINGSGVDYAVKTTPLAETNGGGFCQVDAIFATFLGPTAYFAVVTDSNPNGVSWDGYAPARFGPGDLSVTANGVNYGVGARPIDLMTSYGQINYGSADARKPGTWAAGYSTTGSPPTSFTGSAKVVANPTWAHVDNVGGAEPGMTLSAYFNGNTASVGSAAASWQQLAIPGDPNNPDLGYTQRDWPYGVDAMQPYSTWLYEVAVPLSDLGFHNGANTFSLSFAPDCGNDSLGLSGTVVLAGVPPVPEPVSMIFYATGLVAVGGYVARRRMLRKA